LKAGKIKIQSLCYSPNSDQLACIADKLKIFDIKANKSYELICAQQFIRNNLNLGEAVPLPTSVTYTPNGEFLIAGYSDGTIQRWFSKRIASDYKPSIEDYGEKYQVISENISITDIVISPDCKHLAVLLKNGHVYILDSTLKKCLYQLPNHAKGNEFSQLLLPTLDKDQTPIITYTPQSQYFILCDGKQF